MYNNNKPNNTHTAESVMKISRTAPTEYSQTKLINDRAFVLMVFISSFCFCGQMTITSVFFIKNHFRFRIFAHFNAASFIKTVELIFKLCRSTRNFLYHANEKRHLNCMKFWLLTVKPFKYICFST